MTTQSTICCFRQPNERLPLHATHYKYKGDMTAFLQPPTPAQRHMHINAQLLANLQGNDIPKSCQDGSKLCFGAMEQNETAQFLEILELVHLRNDLLTAP